MFIAGLDETGTFLTNKEVEIFSPPATAAVRAAWPSWATAAAPDQPPDSDGDWLPTHWR